MKNCTVMRCALALTVAVFGAVALNPSQAFAGDNCSDLDLGNTAAIHAALKAALLAVAPNKTANGGLGNHMWGTIVDRDGKVCAVAFTGGSDRNQQWPGSRVISAQKANTAAAFNLPKGVGGTVDALSTANLWTQAQPGGSLFGLQFSNPVDPAVAFGSPSVGGEAGNYGTPNDPLVGRFPGGINVFGGGLALYIASGDKVGGLGVSGDTSCADHNIAWKTRHELELDKLTTAGVSGLSDSPRQDNIIYDVSTRDPHHAVNNSKGFGHPKCGFGEDAIVLPPTQ